MTGTVGRVVWLLVSLLLLRAKLFDRLRGILDHVRVQLHCRLAFAAMFVPTFVDLQRKIDDFVQGIQGS